VKNEKNKLIKIFIFIIFISIILFLIIHFIKIFNKQSKLIKRASQIDRIFMPIFVIPEIDIKKRNEILSISYFIVDKTENQITIEYSVIFKDEDHPIYLINHLYDFYRSFKWGRIFDIESFKINFIKIDQNISNNSIDSKIESNKWFIEFIDFENVFSKDQNYFYKNVKHYSNKIEGISFNKINDRVVIYINTWNHLFSNKDNNPDMNKVIIQEYNVFNLSRNEIENFIKNKK